VAFQQNVSCPASPSSSGEHECRSGCGSSPGERRHGSARAHPQDYRGCVWVLPYAHDRPRRIPSGGRASLVRVKMESQRQPQRNFLAHRMAGISARILWAAPTSPNSGGGDMRMKRKKPASTSGDVRTQHWRPRILQRRLVVALAMVFAPATRAGGVVRSAMKRICALPLMVAAR